jgi:serine phosphatase RsbU (regulator of sigma subunit)
MSPARSVFIVPCRVRRAADHAGGRDFLVRQLSSTGYQPQAIGMSSRWSVPKSQEPFVSLRFKFVLPINLILVVILGTSLAWEWWRLERSELAILRTRLDEEARFVHAAARTFGVTPKFGDFLVGFCQATDATASPEHQVALVDRGGELVASAAAHAHRPINPVGLAAMAEGSWLRRRGNDTYLIRVLSDGGEHVVVAESTRLLRQRVRSALLSHAGWILGLGVLLFVAVNSVMRQAVLRQIRRLHEAALRLEQGQLGAQVEWAGSDELGALSDRFNAMSRALAEQAEDSKRELDAAHRVQSHSLPPSCFELGGVQIAGRCLQRGPVGGDVYDVRLLPGDRVAILVADLSGHDVSAALNTAMLRAIVWREAEQADLPGDVLARLNEQLCRDLPDEHFASAVLAWFDPSTGRLHYANAGHPTSYLRSSSTTWRELESSGPVLGLIPGAEYASLNLEVISGSRLFVCTDGVTEARDPRGRLWGTCELVALLESSEPGDPTQVVDRILERLAQFRGQQPQEDDVTVMVAVL